MTSLNRNRSLSKQIISFFEKEILSGRLKRGDKLPCTNDLAEQFQVNPETVQKSLKKLAETGLIERKPHVGSVVAKSFSCHTIAVVCGQTIFAKQEMEFHKVFFSLMLQELEKDGWAPKIYLTEDVSDSAFLALKQGIDEGRIRAVIQFCLNPQIESYLKNETSVPHSYGIEIVDTKDFYTRALKYMLDSGAKKIAVITGLRQKRNREEVYRIHQQLRKMKKYKDSSIECFQVHSDRDNGYEIFEKILLSEQKFDGVISGNDMISEGILFCMAEHGIRYPQDIKFLTYANKGIDIFSRKPLTKIEVDPLDIVKIVWNNVKEKINGGNPGPHYAPMNLIPGVSCGEFEQQKINISRRYAK